MHSATHTAQRNLLYSGEVGRQGGEVHAVTAAMAGGLGSGSNGCPATAF